MPPDAVAHRTFEYEKLPRFTSFAAVLDDARYQAVPDDWYIGLTDIVDSTSAIAAGQYKSINFAGAAAIAAVRNALGGADIAYAFGGDGASILLAPHQVPLAEAALAATAGWVRDEIGFTLRAALVEVAAIRAAGHDLKVARYAASPNVAYAMFSGGGIAWAERALKQGLHRVAPAAPGVMPDFTGLSCRFAPSPARNGLVLSALIVPTGTDPAASRRVLARVIGLVEAIPAMGRPSSDHGPPLRWPPAGIDIEAQATRRPNESVRRRRAALSVRILFSYLILKLRIPIGSFRPDRYLREVAQNADFRKYDDGLRLTIDCSEPTAAAIEQELRAAEEAGYVQFGLHRQSAALMTCITPSPTDSDHVHFVDGADGGYARAAQRLKAKLATVETAAKDPNPTS